MKTDIELKRDVERALEWEPSIDAREIAVTVKNGVVTLTGHVKTRIEEALKRTAQLDAKNINVETGGSKLA